MNHCDETDARGFAQHYDETPVAGRLGKAKRTPLGGARLSAILSRTGVLEYRNPDGSVRRELRLPEEVEKSLDSLRGAPVVVGHPYEIGGLIDPASYRKYSVGHADGTAKLNPRRNDRGEQLVEGELCVQDAEACSAIDAGALEGISLGYTSRLEHKPGTWNGQPYDCIQRDITYNHVALLKPGGGRVREARVALDAQESVTTLDSASEYVVEAQLANIRRGFFGSMGATLDASEGENMNMNMNTNTNTNTDALQRAQAAARADLDEFKRLHRNRQIAKEFGLQLDSNGNIESRHDDVSTDSVDDSTLDSASEYVVEAQLAMRRSRLTGPEHGARPAATQQHAGNLDEDSNAVVEAQLGHMMRVRGL